MKEQLKPEARDRKQRAEKSLREIEEKLGIEGLFYKKGRAAPASAAPAQADPVARLKALGYPNPASVENFIGAASIGREEVVQLFLAAGMPVDAPLITGYRAFLTAIISKRFGVARLLLAAGADVNAGDENGYLTPLVEMAKHCDQKDLFADMIKAGANVKAVTRGGLTALQQAKLANCTEFVQSLKKAGATR